MKMSPCNCNCFRSFVLFSLTILSIIDTDVNAFTIRKTYNVTNGSLQDLTGAESVQLEVKHDLNKFNGLIEKKSNESNEIPTTIINENVRDANATTSKFSKVETTVRLIETPYNRNDKSDVTTNLEEPILETDSNSSKALMISDIEVTTDTAYIQSTMTNNANLKVIIPDSDQNVSMPINKQSTLWLNSQNETEITTSINTESNDPKSSLPPWKKYTIIERKRVTTADEVTTSTEKSKDMVKAETRVMLEDSVTSDIRPLDGVKRDVSLSTKAMSPFEYLSSTPNYKDDSLTLTEILTKPNDLTTQKMKIESMSSKRAGFLNYSSMSKQIEEKIRNNDSSISTSYGAYTTPILSTTQNESSLKIAEGSRSQTYLNEDAIKEELLQETSFNDNEEIIRNRQGSLDGSYDTTVTTVEPYSTPELARETEWNQQTEVTNTDNPFNVKPIQEKGKGTIVYTVSPNYKPMKKIEIQPPKPFVRDPDDNSWRNESISSLGIVFKPKNSSKPFTQVLKNKTETEWSNILSRDSKNDVPDLRVRLEKITQKRKSKRKKADSFGNIIYTDYEESNSSEEVASTQRVDFTSTIDNLSEVTISSNQIVDGLNALSNLSISTSSIMSTDMINELTTTDTIIELNETTNTTPPSTQSEISSQALTTTQQIPFHKKIKYQSTTVEKGKKYFNVLDYYDNSDESESEYLKLAKLELKKFTVPFHATDTSFATSPPLPYQFTKPLAQYVPERKPTVQYFPPRNFHETKSNRYDNDFEIKIKSNMMKTSPKNILSVTNTQRPDTSFDKYTEYTEERNYLKTDHELSPIELPGEYKPRKLNKNLHITDPPRTTAVQNGAYGVGTHNEGFNRASYIIKNYKDFLDQAAKDYDYERDVDFVPYTEAPMRGVTISDLITQTKDRVKTNINENYDYDAKFRKDVLQRFVDNFNHNDARYHSNFPVLFNNSVQHVNVAEHGEAVATSRAFLKGLYNPSDTKYGHARREPCDPNCDKLTVELSPAYELHYYVPEQEEKEQLEPNQS